MSKRTNPSQAEVIEVMRLMADVAAHRGKPALQRRLLIEGMVQIIGATVGFTFVCDGWKPGLEPRFVDTHVHDQNSGVFDAYVTDVVKPYTVRADPYCDLALSRTDQVDLLTFQDVLSKPKSHETYGQFSALAQEVNMADGLVTWTRQDAKEQGAMTGFALHRHDDDAAFSPRDKALVMLATHELKRLCDRGWFSLPEFTGPLAQEVGKLPPRLAQVLSLLLAGRHPKGIALDLNLSVHTVREHQVRLYRRFDVAGRDELMARFIEGQKDSEPVLPGKGVDVTGFGGLGQASSPRLGR